MGVKPEIAAYLAERAATGLPQVWQAPLAEIRENTKLHIALKQPLLQIDSVEHRSITGPTSALPIRIYRPSKENNLPALVFFHGGGWVLNFLDIYEPALRKIAKNANFIVIAVEYQKAASTIRFEPDKIKSLTTQWDLANAAASSKQNMALDVARLTARASR